MTFFPEALILTASQFLLDLERCINSPDLKRNMAFPPFGAMRLRFTIRNLLTGFRKCYTVPSVLGFCCVQELGGFRFLAQRGLFRSSDEIY